MLEREKRKTFDEKQLSSLAIDTDSQKRRVSMLPCQPVWDG